ncbi:hypothetical protein [Bradyrhizobium elkanii]|uniref:hypothetical protein n=1 Tax=Bradyrhizobium elkanii TaxID=29448 RepID=UPI0003FD9544|nr:hypothetical protein [Bradyrhizobium elkanii]
MSKGKPADECNAQPAVFIAGTEAAADAGMGNTDHGSGLDVEIDEYDELLTALGRSYDDDVRIATHEAGHAVCARLLGHPLGGATADPGVGYEGRVWGVHHMEAFASGRGDASNVREALAPVMPQAGEDRTSVADVFGNVYSQCIELMAGRAAERMLLDGEPVAPTDDLRQARELAMLICTSDEAIESFVAHCDVAAHDLLLPHGDVVIVVSTVLRIKRTLDGVEIDKIISDLQARKALAVERARRKRWQRVVENATSFTPEGCV